MDNKLTQLRQVLEIGMGQVASQKDVATLISGIMKLIAESQKMAKKNTETEIEILNSKLSGEIRSLLSALKDNRKIDDNAFRKIQEQIVNLTLEINNVNTPDYTFIEQKLIDMFASFEKDLPTLGTSFRDGLELLQGDERLSKDAVKGIDKIEEDIKKLKKQKGGQTGIIAAGGNSGGGRIVKIYDISSQLNGVLKTFSLPAFWRVLQVSSSSFPNAFRPIVDYTTDASASTITFTSEISATSTLATGQTITILYSE